MERAAITMLTASRLTSHSHGAGNVSSKSFASKTSVRSGDANSRSSTGGRRRPPGPGGRSSGVVDQIGGHDRGRPTVEREGRCGHPSVPERDEVLQPVRLLGGDDRDRVTVRAPARRPRGSPVARASGRPCPRPRGPPNHPWAGGPRWTLRREIGLPRGIVRGSRRLVGGGLARSPYALGGLSHRSSSSRSGGGARLGVHASAAHRMHHWPRCRSRPPSLARGGSHAADWVVRLEH